MAIAKYLHKNKSLLWVALNGTGIGDETCKMLAATLRENPTLRFLNIDENEGITNVGMSAQKKC